MKIIDEVIAEAKKTGLRSVPGEEIFRLYDTYGFPIDLARDIASDNNLVLDEDGFHRAMDMQRERARASWVGEEEAVSSVYRELLSEVGRTEFAGYDAMQTESIVKAMLKEGKVVKEAAKDEEVEVFLDKTPFYGESGGQVGDTGEMASDGFRALVMNTQKVIEGLNSHIIKIKDGKLRVWDKVTCSVDAARRKAIMSNHTATHLLQAALKNIIGEHVKQAGSLVAPERLRFDFTHFFPLSRDEITSVEDAVNQKIFENINVEIAVMDIKDAVASGATALFGEKYGETVRVVKVPGFSSELCGGTHCKATGDIGAFIIISEGSVASGIRRIEALTGMSALNHFRRREEELAKISDMLKTEKPAERVERLLAEMKEMEREAEKLKGRAASETSEAIMEKIRDINGMKVVSCRVDGLEKKDLRILADNLKDKLGSGVIVLASAANGEAAFLSMVTKDLTKRIKAGEILKKVAEIAGGRGGGKPEMAEGGTKDIAKLDKALDAVYDLIKKESPVTSNK